MKSKKVLIIIISLMILICLVGAIFLYLFIKTDIFKSDEELFAKYMSQNLEQFQELGNLETVKLYKNKFNKDKYVSKTNLAIEYSEGGEVSNPFNNLSASLDVQKDRENEYLYVDGQILFKDEEYLESEIIKEEDLYGIRFSDVAKEFVTIKDDQDLDTIADDIGIDSDKLEKIMSIIDGTTNLNEDIISQDSMKELKEKYSNIITEAITNGTFSKLKKAMITYDNNTIKTNSYMVSLNSEQVENLLIKILNNLKTESVIVNNIDDETFEEKIDSLIELLTEEEEVPEVKITVYEQNQRTIRTIVEIGLDKITIENRKEDEIVKSNIQFAKILSDETNEYDLELIKNTKETQEDFTVTANVVGDESFTLSFSSQMQLTEEGATTDIVIGYKKDILNINAKLSDEIEFATDFEKKQTLTDSNNIVLNDQDEEKRRMIIDILKENVPQKAEKRLNLLKKELELQDEENENKNTSDAEMTQVEINRFNTKFEFYTGDETSAENVKALLEIVKDNLGSCELIPTEEQENTEDIKNIIKLNIKRNNKNEKEIEQVLEYIDDEEKYKISIFYKGENQLIDYITIEEVED